MEIAKTREVATQELIGAMRLQWWRDTLDGVFAGEPRRHPVATLLARAIAQHSLDRALFDRLLDAREGDLSDEAAATLADLTDYARDTSVPLVRLALAILDVHAPAAHEAAEPVGIAWALTGLIRAVPFHARQRLIRLPRDLLDQSGVSARALFAGRGQPQLNAAVRQVAEAAERQLAEARRRRSEVPRAALPALLSATLASGYLALLRRGGYDPFDRRLAASLPFRAWRLLAAQTTGHW